MLSHAFSGELKAVSVVDEAIQDSVAEGGVADNVVPMFDGDLAGDDGRGATVAIIKDLQKVAPFGRIERSLTSPRQIPGPTLRWQAGGILRPFPGPHRSI